MLECVNNNVLHENQTMVHEYLDNDEHLNAVRIVCRFIFYILGNPDANVTVYEQENKQADSHLNCSYNSL